MGHEPKKSEMVVTGLAFPFTLDDLASLELVAGLFPGVFALAGLFPGALEPPGLFPGTFELAGIFPGAFELVGPFFPRAPTFDSTLDFFTVGATSSSESAGMQNLSHKPPFNLTINLTRVLENLAPTSL